MRIANITPQYFTRFRDDNARKVVREVFTAPPEEDYMQGPYNSRFETLDNCQFADIFTSSENSKIKVEFDKEFVEEHDLGYWIENKKKYMEDLGDFDNAEIIALSIDHMNDQLAGIEYEYKPVNDGRYYETEEEQQERRLTYLAQ